MWVTLLTFLAVALKGRDPEQALILLGYAAGVPIGVFIIGAGLGWALQGFRRDA
jgi:cytochrome c biogenesis protein CcdA